MLKAGLKGTHLDLERERLRSGDLDLDFDLDFECALDLERLLRRLRLRELRRLLDKDKIRLFFNLQFYLTLVHIAIYFNPGS